MKLNDQQPVTQDPRDAFMEQVRRELDQSCNALDGHTLSRLNTMRHAALEHKLRKPRAFLLPFGGLVSACVLVLTVSLLDHSGQFTDNAPVNTPLEDLEILTSSESLDFFENYEFYQWLAEDKTSV